LQWPNTPQRKFKKNTERIPFVITCRTINALFQGEENKREEEKLGKLEGKKEIEKKKRRVKGHSM
jgi:hypothetical protein